MAFRFKKKKKKKYNFHSPVLFDLTFSFYFMDFCLKEFRNLVIGHHIYFRPFEKATSTNWTIADCSQWLDMNWRNEIKIRRCFHIWRSHKSVITLGETASQYRHVTAIAMKGELAMKCVMLRFCRSCFILVLRVIFTLVSEENNLKLDFLVCSLGCQPRLPAW